MNFPLYEKAVQLNSMVPVWDFQAKKCIVNYLQRVQKQLKAEFSDREELGLKGSCFLPE